MQAVYFSQFFTHFVKAVYNLYHQNPLIFLGKEISIFINEHK